MKKIRLLLFLLGTFLFLSATAYGATFSDVQSTDPRYTAIETMAEKGYIKGYPDGSFRPEGEITRAEFIAVTNRFFGFTEKFINENFSDVSPADWFYDDVLISLNEGYILGYGDGRMGPSDPVTREQVCAIVDRIMGLPDLQESEKPIIKDAVSDWARDNVSRILHQGIMEQAPDGTFRATEKATRGEVALAYYAVLMKQGTITGHNKDAVLEDTINRFYNKVIPNLPKPSQKEIAEMVANNMQKYLDDKSYDPTAEVEVVKQRYRALSKTDQEKLKDVIMEYIPIESLIQLKDYFGIEK